MVKQEKIINAGDKIIVDGNFETVVTKVDEPDYSFETGRIYQEIYFGMSHCDISRCELISAAGELAAEIIIHNPLP